MYLVDKYRNLDDYADHVFDLCHPIGEIYIRYPGQSSPQDLYKRGTWENISDQFAGLFFRAEGGNASEFQEIINEDNPLVSQEDKIRSLKGAFTTTHSANDTLETDGGFYHIDSADYWTKCYIWSKDTPSRVGWVWFDANQNSVGGDHGHSNSMAGHADGPEIRPINTTIQIWKRTA